MLKGLALKSKVIQLVHQIKHLILKLRILNLFYEYENEFSDFQRAANWLFDKNKKLYCHFLSILILKIEQIKTSSKFCEINAGFADSGLVVCSNEQVEY